MKCVSSTTAAVAFVIFCAGAALYALQVSSAVDVTSPRLTRQEERVPNLRRSGTSSIPHRASPARLPLTSAYPLINPLELPSSLPVSITKKSPWASLDFAPAVPLNSSILCSPQLWSQHQAPTPSPVPCGAPCVAPPIIPGAPAMAIRAVGGLANRIIELISHLAIARRDSRPFVVLWLPGPDCPAQFTDLFQLPIPDAPDVRVVSKISQAPRELIATYGHPHADFDMALLGPMALAVLRPLKIHALAIREVLRHLGPAFSAAHMRRTDLPHTDGLAGDVLDAAVVSWACNDTRRLFVAADQPGSLNALVRILPRDQVVSQYYLDATVSRRFRESGQDLRKTPVSSALVDLWVCSQSFRFVGTPGSTFSMTAEALRVARGLPPGTGARTPPGERVPDHLPRSWRYPVASSAPHG